MNVKARAGECSSIKMRVTGNRVTVSAPREYLYDIKQFARLQEVVLGRLGHQACISGFDLRWRQFEDIVLPG